MKRARGRPDTKRNGGRRQRTAGPNRALAAAVGALALTACSPAAPPANDLPPGGHEARPQRIVSLNLCTDQLLMQMVEPDRIAALTRLASDPRSSAMAREARSHRTTRGSAEEVIALAPDLVLTGTFSTRATTAILRRLGYRVVEFAPESDFAAIRANIALLAQAVGEEARGAAMIARIDAALAALPPPGAPGERPVYADYDANGFTSGDGALVTAVANAAGFDTLGQRLGLGPAARLPLEAMLVARPDVIDLGDDYGAPALATEILRHPAMAHLAATRDVAAVPPQVTACGSALTLRALETLREARGRIE